MAIRFDGTDDFAVSATSPDVPTDGAISLYLVFKCLSINRAALDFIISRWNYGALIGEWWGLAQATDNKLVIFKKRSDNTVIRNVLYSTNVVAANGIYHLVATSNDVANAMVINFGGTRTTGGATFYSGDTTSGVTHPVAVGGRYQLGSTSITERHHNIEVFEAAIWNTQITAAQETLLINSKIKGMPLQIAPSNLKAYWGWGDGVGGVSADGATIKDLSGNGLNLTGNDGANNTGCIWYPETILSYPQDICYVDAQDGEAPEPTTGRHRLLMGVGI